MKEYVVLYEEGPTSWGASVPDLPGCFAAGKSLEETERLIREAIGLYLDQLREDGKPAPEPAYHARQVTIAA